MRDELPSPGPSEATGHPRRKFLLGAAAPGGAAIAAGSAAIVAVSRHPPAAAPIARPAPSGVQFVPKIWGAADVNSAELSQVAHAGSVLLAFIDRRAG